MEYRRFETTYRLYHATSRGLSANKQSKRNARRLLPVYPENERYNSKRKVQFKPPACLQLGPERHTDSAGKTVCSTPPSQHAAHKRTSSFLRNEGPCKRRFLKYKIPLLSCEQGNGATVRGEDAGLTAGARVRSQISSSGIW
jgi:hypothetical protein